MKIVCFLPCRKGSERVPKKNIRPIGGVNGGLIEIKLNQLNAINKIDEIILSTNDDEIINLAEQLHLDKIKIHKRSELLSSNLASTDDLIKHAGDLIPDGHILWTHVTSPFITTAVYEKIIENYIEVIDEGYDSLMTTSLLRGFLWDENGPINYDRNIEKWPRTQTLKPLHEINSGAFICPASTYINQQDRIGKKPYLYPLDKLTGFDIDWPEDFEFAELLLKGGMAQL